MNREQMTAHLILHGYIAAYDESDQTFNIVGWPALVYISEGQERADFVQRTDRTPQKIAWWEQRKRPWEWIPDSAFWAMVETLRETGWA